jgi:hypothetical protein
MDPIVAVVYLDIPIVSLHCNNNNEFSVYQHEGSTMKPQSIVSEGTMKNKRMHESYLCGRCTGTRESERYLHENSACGNDR